MALNITITNAGRAEIIAAENTGTNKVTIVAVALGTGRYTPNKAQTALQAETTRLASIAGKAVADDTIHVMALDESSATYNVGEFGLISDKGTLIAVYSQLPAAGWIIQKAPASTLLLATDIILESLGTVAITFGDVSFINPPATVDIPGVVQLEDSLTSSSRSKALTAAQGKKLQDEKEPLIAVGTTAQYRRGDKTWRDFATDVRATVLAGLTTASAAAVVATDTLLMALGKLQAQITGLANSKLDSTANAVSASKLATARTLSLTGDTTWSVPFDGSTNASGVFTLANSGVTAGSYPKVTVTAKGLVTGGAALTAADIPSLDTSKLGSGVLPVARGGTGNAVNQAATAVKLAAARTLTLTGDGSWSVSFDGSGNESGVLTLAPGLKGQAVGSTAQDPNLATDPVILTNHANSPGLGRYWHITTTFYAGINSGANRAQFAVEYNAPVAGARAAVRSCYGGVWTPWVHTDNNKPDR